MSTTNRLFKHGMNLSILLLILLGVWLCWLAFEVVRAVAFWLLLHMATVAAVVISVIVFAFIFLTYSD